MSDETARAIQDAEAAEAEVRATVDQLKRECLASVADALPGKLDDYAKKLAHDQPDVAKGLGRDGVRALRDELSAAAQSLAAELRDSADVVEWPEKSYVSKDDIHHALFKFMYGPRVDALTAIFKSHGFYYHPTAGVLPQNLYDRDNFLTIANALTLLAKANAATAQAQANHDHDQVESLWED
jgi:hypothetical protein